MAGPNPSPFASLAERAAHGAKWLTDDEAQALVAVAQAAVEVRKGVTELLNEAPAEWDGGIGSDVNDLNAALARLGESV